MVPLTGILYEFEAQEKVIRDAAAALFEKEGMEIPFKMCIRDSITTVRHNIMPIIT